MARSLPLKEQSLGFLGPNSGSQLGINHGNVVNNYNYAQPRAVSPVCRPGEREDFCPFRRNQDDFVPRPDISSKVQSLLEKEASRVALVGITGSGKTELAVQLAHDANHEGTWVFWIQGSSWKTVIRDFESIAGSVQTLGWDDPNSDKRNAVKRWLSSAPEGQWLVIIDGINDESALCGPSEESEDSLIDLLPQPRKGRVLVTTQNVALARKLTGASRSVIAVDGMSREEAIKLMCLRAEMKPLHLAFGGPYGMDLICDGLDCLPLAISQVGSYLNKQGMGTADIYTFSQSFPAQRTVLLEQEDDNDMRRYHGAPKSTMQSLRRAFDRLFVLRPSAMEILCLLSFYGQIAVPLEAIKPKTELDIPSSNSWGFELPELLVSAYFEDTASASTSTSFQTDLDFLVDSCLVTRGKTETVTAAFSVVHLAASRWMEDHGTNAEISRLLMSRFALGIISDPLHIFPIWLSNSLVDVMNRVRGSQGPAADHCTLLEIMFVKAHFAGYIGIRDKIGDILRTCPSRNLYVSRRMVDRLRDFSRRRGIYSGEDVITFEEAFCAMDKAMSTAGAYFNFKQFLAASRVLQDSQHNNR